MTEVLGFDDRIEQLTGYYQSLLDVDPTNPEAANTPDRAAYFNGIADIADGLKSARNGVESDITCVGNLRYLERGFNERYLGDDSDDERRERADILAVVSAPLTTEQRAYRGDRIADLLGRITTGDKIELESFHEGGRSHGRQSATVVSERPLRAMFPSPVFASTVLHVRHAPPVYEGSQGGRGDVLAIGLRSMFQGAGIVIPTRQAAQ